jgi:Domain of Unknown Function (DUF1080)
MSKSRVSIMLLALLASGVSAAGLRADDKPDADGWISLFNGKDLTGWKASEGVEWKVVNGEIVTPAKRSHLFTEREFKNFEYKVDCLTKPGSNSGLYFHTKYEDNFPKTGFEVQVNQTQGDPVKTGSLYNLVRVYSSPVKDDEWYTYHIIVKGREVTVKINDKTLYQYVEPEGVVGPTNKLNKGSFAIQAHDPKSEAHYKNIKVKPLPD